VNKLHEAGEHEFEANSGPLPRSHGMGEGGDWWS